jgi:hypothetical protein
MFPLTVKKDTFTDLVFWMMNTSKNTSTTTPMITPTQVPESRVRPVGFRGADFGRSGPLGTPTGCEVGPSDAEDSSLMSDPPFSSSNQRVKSKPIFSVRPEPLAGRECETFAGSIKRGTALSRHGDRATCAATSPHGRAAFRP